jgi:20S proteasome subunit alpha 3
MVLATEKQEVSHLLEQSKSSEKIYTIDKHVFCVVSGWTADANYLIDYARIGAQQYRFQYQENIPIEQLIIRICDLKQSYTQYGGQRPFGTAFLFAGYDKNNQF